MIIPLFKCRRCHILQRIRIGIRKLYRLDVDRFKIIDTLEHPLDIKKFPGRQFLRLINLLLTFTDAPESFQNI